MPNRLVSRPALPAAPGAFASVSRLRHRAGSRFRFPQANERFRLGSISCRRSVRVMGPMTGSWGGFLALIRR